MLTKKQVKKLMLIISNPLTVDCLSFNQIESLIDKLIEKELNNKPVETTNEQPIKEIESRFYKKLPYNKEFDILKALEIGIKDMKLSRRSVFNYLKSLQKQNLIYRPRHGYYKTIG